MKQRTHTWLAIRAIGLLEEAGEIPGLVKLLKPHVKGSAIGSWIPDLADSKKGSGDIDFHIFKMEPYDGPQNSRFITKKDKLFKQIGNHRLVKGFIEQWGGDLDDTWWNTPYKATPKPGEHLANRAMALTTAIADQLILGDQQVAPRVPGTVRFASNLDPEARTTEEQVATYCFMQSHFVADACQPCHCDKRRAFGYSKGLHKELESHWNKVIGTYFDKKKLFENTDSSNAVIAKAREIDAGFSISFGNEVPSLKKGTDAWLEVVRMCRASFSVANILVPPSVIPYDSAKLTTYDEVFPKTDNGQALLKALDQMVMHDSVLSIAMIWKNIWERF